MLQPLTGSTQSSFNATHLGEHAAYEGEYPWFALKVRSRGEAQVGEALRAKNFETFLPTFQECRKYSDRVKKVETPMFPGYLSCRMDPQRRLPILTTPGVEYILGNERAPEEVPAGEIESLRRAAAAGASAKPWPFLKAGHKVRVEFGSFSGIEGVILREKQSDKLVLSVSILQRSVCIELDRTWIKPV